MKRPKDRFDFDSELGKRLQQLRHRAGLTQRELASAMGRQGKGSHHVAGRLERGEVANPGVGLLADYLRACQAGFADIQDVLDRYTARPTVAEVETRRAVTAACKGLPTKAGMAAEEYDRGISKRAEFVREPAPARAERVRRAERFALSQVWIGRVRREVIRIIDSRHLAPGTLIERYLQDYAASVWRILNKTRGTREPKRAKLLDEAVRPFLGEGGPSQEQMEAVREGLMGFFSRLEAVGELDSPPD